jgi:hypothetical protein
MTIRPVNPSGSDAATPPGNCEETPRPLPPVRTRTWPQPKPPLQPEPDHQSDPEPQTTISVTPPAPYNIGYKNPPKHSQFKPGRSGNPKGRPKGAKGLKTIVRDMMTTKVPVRTASGEKRISRIELVMQKTYELGVVKERSRALSELLRLYSAAVPDAVVADDATPPAEELTETDLAMLNELRAILLADEGGDE